MSDNLKLGHLIEGEEQRDATHIAVAPVIARKTLRPGAHIGLTSDGLATDSDTPIGVVDPFLTGSVLEGDKFWIFLYPGTITALRHEWTHPAFPLIPPAVSPLSDKQWIENYAASIPLGFGELMDAAESFLKYDDYLTHGGRYEGMSLPEEFWTHYQAVTGEVAPESKRHSFFSCSC